MADWNSLPGTPHETQLTYSQIYPELSASATPQGFARCSPPSFQSMLPATGKPVMYIIFFSLSYYFKVFHGSSEKLIFSASPSKG